MKNREPSRPSDAVIKRLFAQSGNRCAFPKCRAAMVLGKTIVGEICHIKAASPNGPRYDPQQSAVDRHSYDNLILLCGTHHTVVDDDPEAYSVERLRKMKAHHERNNASQGGVDLGAELVTSINQSGGITAHTVHQTINVRATAPPGSAERPSFIAAARKFHNERIELITTGKGPAAILDGGALVMHVVPFGAIENQSTPGFDAIIRNPDRFPPIVDNRAHHFKITYSGLLTGSNNDGLAKPQRAYVQVFRSGALEAVASSLARGREHNFLQLPNIQAMIIKYIFLYAAALDDFEVPPPFAVLVSIVGISGMRLLQDFIGNALPEDIPCDAIDRDRLAFQEVIFETAPTHYREAAKLLKQPILDHLANASGISSSPYFDASGNYLLNL